MWPGLLGFNSTQRSFDSISFLKFSKNVLSFSVNFMLHHQDVLPIMQDVLNLKLRVRQTFLGTTEKKVSKTALSTNVKSFERTDVFGDHGNFNFDRTGSFSLSTSAFLAHIQPNYNQKPK